MSAFRNMLFLVKQKQRTKPIRWITKQMRLLIIEFPSPNIRKINIKVHRYTLILYYYYYKLTFSENIFLNNDKKEEKFLSK